MLRAVIVKAARVARNAWTPAVLTVTLVATTSATIAATATTVLSTAQGYTLGADAARTAVTATWNGFTRQPDSSVGCCASPPTPQPSPSGTCQQPLWMQCIAASVPSPTTSRPDSPDSIRLFAGSAGPCQNVCSGAPAVRTAATTAARVISVFTALNTVTDGAATRRLLTWLPVGLRRSVLATGTAAGLVHRGGHRHRGDV